MTKDRIKQRDNVISLMMSDDKEDRLLALEIKNSLNIRFSRKEWRDISDKLTKQYGTLKLSMSCNWTKTIKINSIK